MFFFFWLRNECFLYPSAAAIWQWWHADHYHDDQNEGENYDDEQDEDEDEDDDEYADEHDGHDDHDDEE